MEREETYSEIAIKNIQIILIAKGIKVSDMERAIGMGAGAFSHMKKNGNTNFNNIVKIAKYLNISLDKLVENGFKEDIENRFNKEN